MREFKRASQNISNDLMVLGYHFGNPINEHLLALQMEKDLSPYVHDKQSLSDTIRHRTHLWEYSVILMIKERPDLWNAFQEFSRIFFVAQENRSDELSETFLHYFDSLHKSIADAADLFHLERNKTNEPNHFSAKIALNEIGAMLEGCIQPFVRLFHRLLELSEAQAIRTLSQLDLLSFGQIVSELNSNKLLAPIYNPAPWRLPVSQWRNIVFHNNYSYDDSKGRLICQYGKGSSLKEVSLDYLELIELYKLLCQIYNIHKTAYCLLSLNIKEIITDKIVGMKISVDTVAATIMESLIAGSFYIVSFTWDLPVWKLVVIDQKNRSKKSIEPIMQHLSRFMDILHNNAELDITIKNPLLGRSLHAIISQQK